MSEPLGMAYEESLKNALRSVNPEEQLTEANIYAERLRDKNYQLARALDELLKRYTAMVNSGDCGNWNPEADECVVKAKDALASTPWVFAPYHGKEAP